jgi:hypothetical protein
MSEVHLPFEYSGKEIELLSCTIYHNCKKLRKMEKTKSAEEMRDFEASECLKRQDPC